MDDQQTIPVDFIHGDQIMDGLLKGLKRTVVVKVTNMLTDESLTTDDQCNCIF